jgi:hypothetical protein
MLAGLLGGTAGVLPRMKEAIEGYVPSRVTALPCLALPEAPCT